MKHILLVEPNRKIASLVKEYLDTDEVLTVNTAYSAQDAIYQADLNTPDLVVLELAIPMHNGFAFLHEFRSYADWKDVPLIIHSHLAREEAALSKAWKSLGASAYFYKPETSLSTLKKSVYELLKIDG